MISWNCPVIFITVYQFFHEFEIEIQYARAGKILHQFIENMIEAVLASISALSECYILLDKENQAKSLVDEFYF